MNKFEEVSSINVNKYKERKGRFDYLSWAHAVRILLTHYPDATWVVHEFPEDGTMVPYCASRCGYFVSVSITSNGLTRQQNHPVLDSKNQPIKQPNAFQINTSIQRCLAKCAALFGVGIYIYAGEDLPQDSVETDDIELEQLLTDVEFLECIGIACREAESTAELGVLWKANEEDINKRGQETRDEALRYFKRRRRQLDAGKENAKCNKG